MPTAPAAILAVCLAWLIVATIVGLVGGSLEGLFFERFAFGAVQILSTLVIVWRAFTTGGHDRTAWLLIAASFIVWMIADLVSAIRVGDSGDVPVPSISDIGYLTYVVFWTAAFGYMARSRVTNAPLRMLIDGFAATFAAAALCGMLIFQPLLDTSDVISVENLVNLAYPLSAILLLGILVATLAMRQWQFTSTWILLTLSVLAWFVADSYFAISIAAGNYDPEALPNLGWVWAMFFAALAAWQPLRILPVKTIGTVSELILPLVAGVVAIVVMTLAAFVDVSPLVVGLAAASLLCVVLRMAMTIRDNVAMLQISRREALTDPLTGLGNRRALMCDLQVAFGGPEGVQPTQSLMLALLDLNNFKRYNDSLGHGAGDDLLKALSSRLREVLVGSGTGYRIGGDEFCLLIRGNPRQRQATLTAANAALSETTAGLVVSSSYGTVSIPDEATDANTALRLADQRMYSHKSLAGGDPSSK